MNLLHDLLDASASRFPNNEALRSRGHSTTYAELQRRSHSLATALRAQGVGRGDRVAVYLQNRAISVETALACSRLGAIYVPANPLLKARQLEHLLNMAKADRLVFTINSNFVASGGFGPNQVSTVLGFGALLAFLVTVERDRALRARSLMFGLMLLFAVQSALTFSRGGLSAAAGAMVIASLCLLRDTRSRVTLSVVVTVLALATTFVLVPALDRFAGGKLVTRFKDLNTSGRAELARQEVRLFREHPVSGVGPGGAKVLGRGSQAHTELTRVIAEHGVLGVAALVVLLAMCVQVFRSPYSPREKAVSLALLTWSLLTMMHAATRTVAPAVAFGLAFAALPPQQRKHDLWTLS